MERLIYRRLEAFQFGFRKVRSTIGAIEMVMTTAKDAINGKS